MRIILYTGKGGVGKTSVAAATACRLAKEGKKTLIMSTDQAHSLGDSFELELSGESRMIIENLEAAEIDVIEEGEKAWGNIKEYLKQLLTSKSEGGIEVEELLIFPGIEELFALFKVLKMYKTGRYDVIIVDCAPTGETFALLKAPELFGNMLNKILPIKRKAVKVAGPAIEKVTSIPMPKDSVFTDLEWIMERLHSLQELLMNKDIVSVRIVTTPESIVIKEAKRNFTGMHLHDYNVDAVIVNKVYPQEALKGYFHKWIAIQQKAMKELEESFRDIPMFYLTLQKKEIKSVPALLEVAGLYGETDPAQVLHREKIFELKKVEGNDVLIIKLPNADKADMELVQRYNEIEIALKNERRSMMLPDELRGKNIQNAKLEEGVLRITFVTPT